MNTQPKTDLRQDYDTLRNEHQVCRQKLKSKCEALLILSRDLDQCRQERDQFKLMAEQVQARYQSMKRQLAGVGPRPSFDDDDFTDMKRQSLAQLLCEMRESNKALQFEVDGLKQKHADAQGDIKLLREQIARQRVGTTDEGINTRHFPAHEREDLVQQLETAREQNEQLERDLQQVLDEKEEQETERDVYKNKYERLNQELNYILKGDEKRIVDIDGLSMENKYLHERLKQMEEEKSMAMATVSKYKNLLDRKKNKGILKLGHSRSGGVVISQKQVQRLLANKLCTTPTVQMMGDLQSLSGALLEALNDKNMALSHQRKTNKILGNRVSELENKLKTLEVAGLWNVPERGDSNGLEKLKLELEQIQTLIPSSSSLDFDRAGKDGSDADSEEATPSCTPPTTPNTVLTPGGSSLLADLDLLPTRETPGGATDFTNASSSFSAAAATTSSSSPHQLPPPLTPDALSSENDPITASGPSTRRLSQSEEEEHNEEEEEDDDDDDDGNGELSHLQLVALVAKAAGKVTHTTAADSQEVVQRRREKRAVPQSSLSSPPASPRCSSPLLEQQLDSLRTEAIS